MPNVPGTWYLRGKGFNGVMFGLQEIFLSDFKEPKLCKIILILLDFFLVSFTRYLEAEGYRKGSGRYLKEICSCCQNFHEGDKKKSHIKEHWIICI